MAPRRQQGDAADLVCGDEGQRRRRQSNKIDAAREHVGIGALVGAVRHPTMVVPVSLMKAALTICWPLPEPAWATVSLPGLCRA